ncbi:hypothetical protein LPJ66_004713 [Kickxella alabastrina]|uniref:Uncharacterized protein n=1 Tax=Kickxella alabastrina TaxID=61397 RepID=A0ACC1IMB8_9FUNG|nr:hypothetical protein LPJ66_004713 [Kickxella alabastrina]
MRAFTTIATLVSAISVAVGAAPVAEGSLVGDLGELIAEPLMIYFQPGSGQLMTTVPGGTSEEETKQTTASSTSASTSTTIISATTSSTVISTSVAVETSASTYTTEEVVQTSSSATEPVHEEEKEEVPVPSNGSIPDGQGNDFNTPSGAIRFPWNYGNGDHVVPLTPSSKNGGWAMSPDQLCKPSSWCPYACSPGYYSAQWDPTAVLYNGDRSMNGGLYADSKGQLSKPFPERAFCEPGMMNAGIKNTLGKSVSACQTVYPGNEAMIIPSVVLPGATEQLNVVPNTYWLGTSSQFYVNLAGSTAEQCVWGNSDKPVGNWGPYIFGSGQGKDGNTYISVQFNPLYHSAGFDISAAYNVNIECVTGKCNFPEAGQCRCEKGVCSVGNGCTVTLGQGASANFVLY